MQARQTEEVADEFCPNEEYITDDLNDDNSVTFQFIIEDPVLSKSCDAFESQVKENFVDTKVKASDQFYVISGYEQLEIHSKFYLKLKNKPEILAAVGKMKSESENSMGKYFPYDI